MSLHSIIIPSSLVNVICVFLPWIVKTEYSWGWINFVDFLWIWFIFFTNLSSFCFMYTNKNFITNKTWLVCYVFYVANKCDSWWDMVTIIRYMTLIDETSRTKTKEKSFSCIRVEYIYRECVYPLNNDLDKKNKQKDNEGYLRSILFR